MRSRSAVVIAGLLNLLVLSGCSEKGGGFPSGAQGAESEESRYRLVALDSEKEVRRRFTGEVPVPRASFFPGRFT